MQRRSVGPRSRFRSAVPGEKAAAPEIRRVARTPSATVEATAFATAPVGDPFSVHHGRGADNAAVSGRTARRSASRSVRCTAKFSASWLPRRVERFVVARCIVRCRQSSRVDRAPARVVDAVGRVAMTKARAWSQEGGHAASTHRAPVVAAERGARREGRRAQDESGGSHAVADGRGDGLRDGNRGRLVHLCS